MYVVRWHVTTATNNMQAHQWPLHMRFLLHNCMKELVDFCLSVMQLPKMHLLASYDGERTTARESG